jgi:hypothetical protein
MLRIFVSQMYVETLTFGWIPMGWQVINPMNDKRVVLLENFTLADLIRDIVSRYQYHRNLEIIDYVDKKKYLIKRHGKFHSVDFSEIASELNDTRTTSSISFNDDGIERF